MVHTQATKIIQIVDRPSQKKLSLRLTREKLMVLNQEFEKGYKFGHHTKQNYQKNSY